jgi:hypothetical protein
MMYLRERCQRKVTGMAGYEGMAGGYEGMAGTSPGYNHQPVNTNLPGK